MADVVPVPPDRWLFEPGHWADPAAMPAAIYPEPSGLLGWGYDGGGGNYHWHTADPDPERWTVATTGRPVFDPDVQHHLLSMTPYVDALATGTVKAAALGGWPGARLERASDDGDR